jgi:gliding motility-associated-like protein
VKSGTYYAEGYYEINMNATTKATCRSAVRTPVEVAIHDLSDLTIEGDETVCPGATAKLTAKAISTVPGTVTYSWEDGEDSESGEYVTPAMVGAYNTVRTFKVEASAGACVKTLSGTFDVKIDRGVLTGAMSVNGEATDLYKTCGGESLTLSTTHEGTDIRWTTTDGEPVGEGAEQTVNPAETTRYVVTLTNVCETSDTVTVKVMPLSVTADWSSLATTVCEGDGFSASLTVEGYDAAEQGAYIRWYKDGEELAEYAGKTSIGKVAAEASDAGAYSYKVSNGICELPETEDLGELKVVEKPTFSVTEGVVSCSGDPVEIGVTMDGAEDKIIWKDDSSTEATRTVSPMEDTEYVFTVSRGGVCKVDGMLEVSVKSKPAVVLRDDTICSGHTIKLRASVTGDELTAYEWMDASGAPLSSDVTMSVTPEGTSTYTFTVSSESCGDASGEVTVTVNPTPEIEVDSISLRDREIIITNEDYSADYLYKLDKGEWQEDNLFENISFNLHTVYVQDNHGCEGSLMFELKAPDISIPIVFTPNEDGVQDGWDVSHILESYPSASVVIYDRFGKVIAELQGDTSSWDGTYNGNPLPSTDYWYTIRIPEIIKIYNGHFTLIRSK